MLRLLILLLPLSVLADPVALILQYAKDTGDVAGAERLSIFYGENLPADKPLYKALGERLADGSWQSLDRTARDRVETFGFTAPAASSTNLIEALARAVVTGISPQNLKARAALAHQYGELLPDTGLFSWMGKRLDVIREQETKRVSLLRRGQMILEDANKRVAAINSSDVPENRYEKLQQMKRETASSKAREEATRAQLDAERMRGMAMVNESYDFPEAGAALQAFVKEAAVKLREAQP